MSVDVLNESGAEVDEAALVALAGFLLARLRIHPLAELSVLLVDAEAMATLHEKFMHEPGPTDVLSFPMDELRPGDDDETPEGLLGDVVLCPQVAESQARAAGHSAEEELHHLFVHGVLHLLGYDHAEPDEEREMVALHDRLLAEWRSERTAAEGRS